MASPLIHRGYMHPFRDGRQFLYGVGEVPRTVTELAMYRCSSFLRSKPDWRDHVMDEVVRQQWAIECTETVWIVPLNSGPMSVQLSHTQIKYVLDELSGYAALYDEKYRWQSNSQVSCADRIWQSDTFLHMAELPALDSELNSLSSEITLSHDATTVDLIDPYRYCLAYGDTAVYHKPHTPSHLLPVVPPDCEAFSASPLFVCIPTPFSVSSASDPLQAKALSYIVNVDPHNTALYTDLEVLVARCVPLFEHVLTDLHRTNALQLRVRAMDTDIAWDEPDEPYRSDDEDNRLVFERELRNWALQRPAKMPDVPRTGYPGDLERRQTVVSLRGKTIKAIVRVTEIRLRPGGPEFGSTPWHVEGMLNEHIVACTIYCAAMTNITPPSLEFRTSVTSPRNFPPGDANTTFLTWGLGNLSPCNQRLGHVPLCPRRAIAWPNVYQHRLTPARLLDSGAPGSLTLISVALLDPELGDSSVISNSVWGLPPTTDRVPPQEKAWIARAAWEALRSRLPVELIEQIVHKVEGLLTVEDAEARARVVREERERFWEMLDECHFCLPFDVWAGP
ncbi:uncharacterized protein LAESUDRAFT_648772 [Laetiporus sulphureus 93-53]|uniref:Uncharacterized protein n=1 Tax=Laetiporus sulphureus 93-53 TaxID=1314785 RepID=A0A165FDP2_9APHY|nr:uncharacterized protein LAESUDRAFT_648772 [Laetiporus sulphureus 93-53]KZT08812.1 hypothetical protein LAESUDRAFT_648772 [Laetiporus sulphureus 93-53]